MATFWICSSVKPSFWLTLICCSVIPSRRATERGLVTSFENAGTGVKSNCFFGLHGKRHQGLSVEVLSEVFRPAFFVQEPDFVDLMSQDPLGAFAAARGSG